MPGESMINEDGEVLVGEDGYELTSDDADECVECCGGVSPCEIPPPMTVCASYDLFNLAPAPGDGGRRQILLPLPGGAATTMTVQLRAEIDWSGRGGPQFGDVLAYTLKTGGLNDPLAGEIVSLRPIVQQDAGACWRIVEWRGEAVIWFDQVINTSGGVSTYTVGACVHLYMTADGWVMAIDIIDALREGTFVFRRPGGGSSDAKGGFGDAGHQSTIEGLGQQRVPAASQVVAGRGTNMTAGLGDYIEPPPGVSPRGCPPYLGPLSVRAGAGTKCTPGQVTAPGRFRMKWHAEYDYSQTADQGANALITHEVQDFVIEFRDPYTPPEDWRTITLNRWVLTGRSVAGGQVTVLDSQGQFSEGNRGALQTLLLMVDEAMSLLGSFATQYVDFRDPTLSGCRGKRYLNNNTFVQEWTATNTITSRRVEYTLKSVGSEVVTDAKAVVGWTLEPIDVLTCSGPGIVPPMPAVRTLGEAGELVGRLLRGEMGAG